MNNFKSRIENHNFSLPVESIVHIFSSKPIQKWLCVGVVVKKAKFQIYNDPENWILQWMNNFKFQINHNFSLIVEFYGQYFSSEPFQKWLCVYNNCHGKRYLSRKLDLICNEWTISNFKSRIICFAFFYYQSSFIVNNFSSKPNQKMIVCRCCHNKKKI